ncbi:uncharacterized protein LOC127266616 isoform X4 [Andrographis paniculata]|uniref:uncharacterized protein LOC127266616 isoform X4 n=1 Tax=Andrographis paniculata TaxID=175694 RepID=UPI0021E71323|nr:uncharacterized protein LOC127266616 isoform X4 [Andrographis paniculata]
MQSRKLSQLQHRSSYLSYMFILSRRFQRLCSTLRSLLWQRPKRKLVIRRLQRKQTTVRQAIPIRIASFNAALFSLAPAVPKDGSVTPLSGVSSKPKPKVSINLPENEISLAQNKQDVKAEEEKDMKPLSEVAAALGMEFVFAESWAPEYGNAVLSKWPIKKWKVQRIHDDDDFRNVIKATVDVPFTGELNVYCTQLDHLDESWRMKQINAIFQSNDQQPHILAGGLNSLDSSDYSPERWNNIIKYYEELGKPTPRVEVTNFLKRKAYTDAKNFPGECEPVVMIAKGQNVQGTCKYGTRVDYILGSQGLPYSFVPGSYSVLSSKGTSDHHIVKVDVVGVINAKQKSKIRRKKLRQRVVVALTTCSSRGIWEVNS